MQVRAGRVAGRPDGSDRVARDEALAGADRRSCRGARTSWSCRPGARSRRGCRSRRRRSRPTARSRDRRRPRRCRPRPGSRCRCASSCREGRSGRSARRRAERGTAAASARARRRTAASVAGPATPSAPRPAHAWKRRSAVSPRAPRRPSNGPDAKPRVASSHCSAATSQPRAPAAMAREPSRGRPRQPSAARVRGPAMPSTTRPRRAWKRRTPSLVIGPRTPSTVAAYSPRARSATWSAATPGRPEEDAWAEVAFGSAWATGAAVPATASAATRSATQPDAAHQLGRRATYQPWQRFQSPTDLGENFQRPAARRRR